MILSGLRAAGLATLILLAWTGPGHPEGMAEAPFKFDDSLLGERLGFLFQHRAVEGPRGQFVVKTNDPVVLERISQELMKPESKRSLIIIGPIGYGNGGHNLQWHWHYVPDGFNLVPTAIEMCDGTPEMVEKDVKYWVDTVKGYCPSMAYPVKRVS